MAVSIGDPFQFVEMRFGVQLKRIASNGEHAGPCPWCGGDDRFHVWPEGNYFCRPGPGHCGRQGWLDQLDGVQPPTDEQRNAWRIARLEREMAETKRRVTALEQMHACTDHLAYHDNLNRHPEAVDYWLAEGMTPDTIHRYQLGYCERCPTFWQSPSYTIPVVNGGLLENIRHRLVAPDGTGKYRPHMAGLPASLFNADALDDAPGELIVTEGEKKSIVLAQEGFANVGISGQRTFRREWLPRFEQVGRVYVALDPDATESAFRLATLLPTEARVVLLPVKPDDFFVRYGGNQSDMQYFLDSARPASGKANGR